MGPCVLLPFLLKRKEKTKKKRPLKKMSQKEDASQNEDECANGWTTVTRKKKKKYAVQNKSLADEIGGKKELWKLDEEAAVFIYDTYYVGKIVHVFPQYATISIDYYEKRNKMSMTKNFCYHSIYSTKNFPHNSEGGPWKIVYSGTLRWLARLSLRVSLLLFSEFQLVEFIILANGRNTAP